MTIEIDCPRCDAAETLEPVRVESRGVIVATCSCCAVTVRISPSGGVVHQSETKQPKTDIMGNPLDSD